MASNATGARAASGISHRRHRQHRSPTVPRGNGPAIHRQAVRAGGRVARPATAAPSGCLTRTRGRCRTRDPRYSSMDAKSHWEHVYSAKPPTSVSWYQPEARLSLHMVARAAPDLAISIIDVGGGASTLVDGLVDAGYTNITVL